MDARALRAQLRRVPRSGGLGSCFIAEAHRTSEGMPPFIAVQSRNFPFSEFQHREFNCRCQKSVACRETPLRSPLQHPKKNAGNAGKKERGRGGGGGLSGRKPHIGRRPGPIIAAANGRRPGFPFGFLGTVRSDEWPAWFSFWFSGGFWRALATKGTTAWAFFFILCDSSSSPSGFCHARGFLGVDFSCPP